MNITSFASAKPQEDCFALVGYQVIEQVYSGSRTCVYRAIRHSDQQPVILKVLKNQTPTFSELVQFRTQYTITRDLNLPGVLKTDGLDAYDNRFVLVMEDFGGIPLLQYLEQQPLAIASFLDMALQLAQILHRLHQQGIIHKDIKPANILIHPQSREIKLIDFSIASQLPREMRDGQNPTELEGTLAYMAPEQTGRMSRSVDYRSDFYALGVTFYELLTGTLPFPSNDPMELVHSHLAKQPLPPDAVENSKLGVPKAFAKIVMKLMAKNAEDRYQSALGLHHDLVVCWQQWQTTGAIADFAIGQHDLSDRFLIPEKLYGRATAVAELLAAFDRVAGTGDAPNAAPLNPAAATTSPPSELLLVAGFSGIGKTAVVNEIHKPVVRQRGYFIKGKYNQFQQNIPLSGFVQAFQDLIGQLLSESDSALAEWKTKILAAVGENGQILIEVIPELKQLIGTQPEPPQLSSHAAQNRFKQVFQQFVRVFTTPEHPLVIFLDDLQWADLSSLHLLQSILSDLSHLLVLGAYRDNEVSPSHPLMNTINEMRQSQLRIQTITLQTLSQNDANQLITDTLGCALELAQPLTRLVYQKTQGNPFFTTQLLKALHQQGCITFDYGNGYWQCDITQARSLTLTDDVVEFMAAQLQQLPPATQDILKLAACIGAQFDLNTLAIISEQAVSEVAALLWNALREGLILPITETYKFFQTSSATDAIAPPASTVAYRFLHDRVQQAAYFLIPEDQKQHTHLRIGQLLLQNTPSAEREARIFEIVNQLNYGISLLEDPDHREELAELNCVAGRRAKLASAFDSAYTYFEQGRQLLAPDCWQRQYSLALDLSVGAAEAACLKTDFETMKARCDEILVAVTHISDRVKVYELLIFYYHTQSQFRQAVTLAVQTLAHLGEPFPANPTGQDFLDALQTTMQLIQQVGMEHLAQLPPMQDPQKLAAMRLLRWSCYPAYFAAPEMLGLLVCRLIDVTLKHGYSPLTPFAFGIFSVLMNGGVGDIATGQQFGELAIALEAQQPDLTYRAVTYNAVYGLSRHFYQPVQTCLKPLLAGYQSFAQNGDSESSAYCLINAYFCSILSGQNLDEIQNQFQTSIQQVMSFKQEQVIHQLHIWSQVIQNLTETVNQPALLQGDYFDIEVKLPELYQNHNFNTINYAHTAQAMLAYLLGDYSQALSQATTTAPNLGASTGKFFVAAHNFYYSLSLTALYAQATEAEQRSYLEQLQQNQQQLKRWADHCPANFLAPFLLVEAELYRIQRDVLTATDRYDQAIAAAKKYGFTQNEAIANELAAKFYLDWHKDRIAQDYLTNAYYAYARWGATTKVQDLEQRYPHLLSAILQQPQVEIGTSDTMMAYHTAIATANAAPSFHSHRRASQALDLEMVLKASQMLSSEMELDKLLTTLLQVVIADAGADKCAFVRVAETGLVVEAITWIGAAGELLSTLPAIALEECHDLPVSLIRLVKHTLDPVVITNATVHTLLETDPYGIEHHPKSILCMPIVQQSKLLGLLYLENQLVIGAFTDDRIEILNLLCSQVAISLENARLYQNSQQTLNLLQMVLNTIPQAVFWKDRNLVYQGGNPVFAQFAGLASPAEIVGKTDNDFPWHQQETRNYQAYDRRVMQSNTPEIGILESFQKPDDTIGWLETSKTPLRDEKGNVIGVLGCFQDVTERQRADAQLRSSEQDLRTILDSVYDAIFIHDLNGQVLDVNQRALSLYGLHREQIIHSTIQVNYSSLNSPLNLLPEIWQNVVAGQNQLFEWKAQRLSDGTIFDVEIYLQQVVLDDKNVILANVRDISDRKRAEMQVRESQELLQLVMDNIPQLIFWKDLNSTYLGCNQNFAEAAGVELPQHICGKTDYDLPWTEAEATWYRACDRRVMDNNQAELHIIATQLQADGDQVWVDTNKIPLHDVHGNVVGILGTYEDITDRKKAEETLRQSEAELKQKTEELEQALRNLKQAQVHIVQSEKMSSLGNLVAGVAHEINNPVNFIHGNLSHLDEYAGDLLSLVDHCRPYADHIPGFTQLAEELDLEFLAEDLQKMLASMHIGTERIRQIVLSLRNFSRLDEANLKPVNIHEGIDNTLIILQHRLKAKAERPEIQVMKEYGSLPEVECYAGQLNQVFMNILVNAIDALEEANHGFTFDEIRARQNQITIRTTQVDSEHAQICIIDNGPGMSEAVQHRIFEPMFTTKGIGKGTGLGLSISYQIITQKHHGSLVVHSALGQGSEFIITLPIQLQDSH